MNANQSSLSESALSIATDQAAKDAQLMAELRDRRELMGVINEGEERVAERQRRVSHAERVRDAQNAAIVAAMQRLPMNRAERRAQVKSFAALLRAVSR